MLLAAPLAAEPVKLSPPTLAGLLDVRYTRTSQQRGWLNGGTNKLRYGGADKDGNGSGDRNAHVFGVPQVSLLLDAALPANTGIHVQTNFNADTDSGPGSIGLIEAYARGAWTVELGRFEAKAGAFIPKISREHTERAWSTRHTLTPSAIGSWIAEEVRSFGTEGSWKRAILEDGDLDGKLTAGLFSGNDGTGRILLYRGWSLHDYQAPLDASLPAPRVGNGKPFSERDGRVGFYTRSEFSTLDGTVKAFSGYWDNNGDHDSSPAGTSIADEIWNTQFWDGGVEFETESWTVIGHYMGGQSASRACPRWPWQAWYALASHRRGPWTLSGRYDHFSVNRKKFENGYAITTDLMREFGKHQQLALEYVYLLARPNIVTRPSSRKDQLFQMNYRLLWGS